MDHSCKHTGRSKIPRRALVCAVGFYLILVACVTGTKSERVRVHRWWAGLGPVLPHDSFPADCTECHLGQGWHTLVDDFSFDHKERTGVALSGAHKRAQCLRCHNDRGDVSIFAQRGCVGCHEDVHLGRIGPNCADCHTEQTWQPFGQVERHARTRFPLEGAHVGTSCRSCHLGAEVGLFAPTPVECSSCHQADLARTNNHLGFGWTHSCDRCHQPFSWQRAELDQDF